MGEHLEKAQLGWGTDMPAWVRALAMACDQSSQNKTAKLIEYSTTTISLVVKGTYTGDLIAVERAVNARLENAKIDCPVVGELPLAVCLKNQRPPMRITNSEQVKFIQTCPTCPNGQLGGK